jgi:lipopolysaccharide export system protein LptA
MVSFALTSDQYLPYHVRADQITYERLQHQTIYVGHVHATQGTTELDGDKMIVYDDVQTHAISRIVTTGHPAHYHTLPDKEKFILYAKADTIKYEPLKAQVWLIQNAQVNFKQDIFIGPHIWYDIQKQTVVSSSYHGKTGTTVVVEPQDAANANTKR